jgi:hypothetical protein
MMTLDAAKRDVCVVKRQTTSTPLQALVLMNDPQYVEVARAVAQRAMTEMGAGTQRSIGHAFRLLIGRHASERELAVLTRLYDEQCQEFKARPDDALALLAVGDHQRNEQLDSTQLAAMTIVAQALLNHDESVTKR